MWSPTYKENCQRSAIRGVAVATLASRKHSYAFLLVAASEVLIISLLRPPRVQHGRAVKSAT